MADDVGQFRYPFSMAGSFAETPRLPGLTSSREAERGAEILENEWQQRKTTVVCRISDVPRGAQIIGPTWKQQLGMSVKSELDDENIDQRNEEGEDAHNIRAQNANIDEKGTNFFDVSVLEKHNAEQGKNSLWIDRVQENVLMNGWAVCKARADVRSMYPELLADFTEDENRRKKRITMRTLTASSEFRLAISPLEAVEPRLGFAYDHAGSSSAACSKATCVLSSLGRRIDVSSWTMSGSCATASGTASTCVNPHRIVQRDGVEIILPAVLPSSSTSSSSSVLQTSSWLADYGEVIFAGLQERLAIYTERIRASTRTDHSFSENEEEDPEEAGLITEQENSASTSSGQYLQAHRNSRMTRTASSNRNRITANAQQKRKFSSGSTSEDVDDVNILWPSQKRQCLDALKRADRAHWCRTSSSDCGTEKEVALQMSPEESAEDSKDVTKRCCGEPETVVVDRASAIAADLGVSAPAGATGEDRGINSPAMEFLWELTALLMIGSIEEFHEGLKHLLGDYCVQHLFTGLETTGISISNVSEEREDLPTRVPVNDNLKSNGKMLSSSGQQTHASSNSMKTLLEDTMNGSISTSPFITKSKTSRGHKQRALTSSVSRSLVPALKSQIRAFCPLLMYPRFQRALQPSAAAPAGNVDTGARQIISGGDMETDATQKNLWSEGERLDQVLFCHSASSFWVHVYYRAKLVLAQPRATLRSTAWRDLIEKHGPAAWLLEDVRRNKPLSEDTCGTARSVSRGEETTANAKTPAALMRQDSVSSSCGKSGLFSGKKGEQVAAGFAYDGGSSTPIFMEMDSQLDTVSGTTTGSGTTINMSGTSSDRMPSYLEEMSFVGNVTAMMFGFDADHEPEQDLFLNSSTPGYVHDSRSVSSLKEASSSAGNESCNNHTDREDGKNKTTKQKHLRMCKFAGVSKKRILEDWFRLLRRDRMIACDRVRGTIESDLRAGLERMIFFQSSNIKQRVGLCRQASSTSISSLPRPEPLSETVASKSERVLSKKNAGEEFEFRPAALLRRFFNEYKVDLEDYYKINVLAGIAASATSLDSLYACDPPRDFFDDEVKNQSCISLKASRQNEMIKNPVSNSSGSETIVLDDSPRNSEQAISHDKKKKLEFRRPAILESIVEFVHATFVSLTSGIKSSASEGSGREENWQKNLIANLVGKRLVPELCFEMVEATDKESGAIKNAVVVPSAVSACFERFCPCCAVSLKFLPSVHGFLAAAPQGGGPGARKPLLFARVVNSDPGTRSVVNIKDRENANHNDDTKGQQQPLSDERKRFLFKESRAGAKFSAKMDLFSGLNPPSSQAAPPRPSSSQAYESTRKTEFENPLSEKDKLKNHILSSSRKQVVPISGMTGFKIQKKAKNLQPKVVRK